MANAANAARNPAFNPFGGSRETGKVSFKIPGSIGIAEDGNLYVAFDMAKHVSKFASREAVLAAFEANNKGNPKVGYASDRIPVSGEDGKPIGELFVSCSVTLVLPENKSRGA